MVKYLGDGSRLNREGVTFAVDVGDEQILVTFCTPNIVRVRMRSQSPEAELSYVLPRVWTEPEIEAGSGEPVRIATSALAVTVGTRPLRPAFEGSRRGVMLFEPTSGGMGTEVIDDGSRRTRVRACFQFAGEQHFCGLGHGGRQLDRLGEMRQFWNTQIGHGPGSDIAIPLLVSNLGYGLFSDNTSDGTLSVGRSDDGLKIVYTTESGPLDWYFLIGPDLRGLMNEVAKLLGRAPLPPRWALRYCSPRATSTTRRSSVSCPGRSARSGFPAME